MRKVLKQRQRAIDAAVKERNMLVKRFADLPTVCVGMALRRMWLAGYRAAQRDAKRDGGAK